MSGSGAEVKKGMQRGLVAEVSLDLLVLILGVSLEISS